MPNRTPGIGLAAVLAGAFGIRCGIPLIATLGLLGVLAGLSLASWALIGFGAAAVAFGLGQLFRRTRRSGPGSSTAEPAESPSAGDQVEAVDVDPSEGTLT